MDLSKVFVYAYQRNLRSKVRSKDPSLRVIAIPELSRFFMPPITLDKALVIYGEEQRIDMMRKKIEEGEFREQVISVCSSCRTEKLSLDKGIERDNVPKGWILVEEGPDIKLFCSKECSVKHLNTVKG